MSDALLVERVRDVVTLTMNRPDIRNAMDQELTEAFSGAIDDIAADASVRAVIVTGAGRAFCSGGDLSWIEPGPGADVVAIRAKMRAFYPKFLKVRDLDVPVIAAINGAAVGAGLCLAMACDIRVASVDAKLSAPFTKLGMHPGMAATYLLTRLVGTARASELLFTSSPVSAEGAERIGLVNRVVVADQVLPVAREIADQIAATAPIATKMMKRAIYLSERSDMETMLEYEALAQPVTMGSADFLEGLTAFREKRAPEFTGR